MRSNVTKNGGYLLFFCLLSVLTVIHFYQRNLLAYSGDEPRFTYYSYSIAHGDILKYSPQKFAQETGSPLPPHFVQSAPITLNIFNKTMFMMNSIIAPLLYAPALYFGKPYHSWELLRTAAFFYYCGSLFFIWLSLRTLSSPKEAIIALAITSLSLPQLAQMSLGNTEQIAIFFLSIALYFLMFRRLSLTSILVGAISMCLTAYASMRSIPIVGSVAIGFLIRLWNTPSIELLCDKLKALYLFLLISFFGAIGWIILQVSFTGTIAGSSKLDETPIGKSPIWILHRLFAPMLNHKDGIFWLFPLVFASLLGLAYAAKNKNLIAWVCLGAWVSYYCIISMAGQAEGYPGRLQFVLIEFFVIGLVFYIRYFKNTASIILLLIGIAVSFLNIFMHLSMPDLLLENRQYGLFQQVILAKTHILDLGQYLIWDQHSMWSTAGIPLYLNDSWKIGYSVFSCLGLTGILLFLSLSKRLNSASRKISGSAAIVIMLVGTLSLFVIPIPETDFLISQSYQSGKGIINLNFKKPIGGRVTVIFNQEAFWQPPEYPSYFTITVKTTNGISKQYEKRSIPEIRLSKIEDIKSITISGDIANTSWSTLPIHVYVAPFRYLIGI